VTGGQRQQKNAPISWPFVDEVRAHIEERHKPDGFNVGFNAGTVAGQTIELDVFGDPHQLGRLLSSENR
jgi:hypothetical protein